MVAGLRTGVYNFATLVPSQATAAKAAGLDVFVQPGFNAEDISINVNKAPFANRTWSTRSGTPSTASNSSTS